MHHTTPSEPISVNHKSTSKFTGDSFTFFGENSCCTTITFGHILTKHVCSVLRTTNEERFKVLTRQCFSNDPENFHLPAFLNFENFCLQTHLDENNLSITTFIYLQHPNKNERHNCKKLEIFCNCSLPESTT